MKSFLERKDRWGNGYSLWLLFIVVFATPLMVWSVRQIRMENDVAGWLPKDDPQSKILTWYQELFPEEDRVLVSWDDCNLTDPRIQQLCVLLEGTEKDGVVEGGSPYIKDVKQPADLLQRMLAEDIPFETALDRTKGLLLGDGPLCLAVSDEAKPQLSSLKESIQSLATQKLGHTVQFVERTMPTPDSAHIAMEDERAWKLHYAADKFVQELQRPDLQLFWPRMHIDTAETDAFRSALSSLSVSESKSSNITSMWYVTGSMAALSISFSNEGVDDHSEAIAAIYAAAEKIGINRQQLHLGGRPVAGTEMNKAVKHAAWNRAAPVWDLLHRSPLLLSVLISVVLSYMMLKSFRLCFLVQIVSVLSAVSAVALVTPTGGSMNMVLVVMPTLLMVISVSGAIHICNYWKNSGIDDPVRSVTNAASIAWLPCFLASATTAIGLASLIVSSLIPVRDFGIYASIGCIISFGCVLYLLPALMLYWPARPPRPEQINNHWWNQLGQFLSKYKWSNCWFNAAITAACVWGLFWFRTETKVIRYFPDESKVVRDYSFLEQNLSGIVSVDTLVRFSKTQQENVPFLDRARKVLEVQEALRNHPEVSGTLSLASFLRLEKPDRKSMSVMERRNEKLRENLIGEKIHEKILKGGEDAENLASMIALPDTAADWNQDGDHLLNEANDEVWRITCQSSILSDYDYATLTKELADTTEKLLVDFPDGKPAHVVTGLVPIFLRTQQALLESLISSFGMALVLIMLVMIFLLRSVSAAFYSMLPNVFPIAVMFGLLGWCDIHVDIGTMITASVALGIAVDGTLHLMTWFQQLLREGMSKKDAVAKSLEHCGPALWQTSAAVGFGMLTLYPVELLLISRFGWIMCGLIFAALWGDVILLPSLLAGPLGSILEKIEQRRKEKESRDSSQPPEQSGTEGTSESAQPDPNSGRPELRVAFTAPGNMASPRVQAVWPRRVADT